MNVLLSIPAGLALALLDSSANFGIDWLVYSLLISLTMAAIILLTRALSPGTGVRTAVWAAFWIRLVVGVVLWFVLPLSGYTDNPAAMSGYLFKDAYYRDQAAWEMSHSDEPVINTYLSRPESTTDQYGGMLALSTLLYRYLSPDAHRPFAVLILTAGVMALGTLFAWGSGKNLFGEKAGSAAAWIFALYPEGVLLGASQMREPFVMSALALITYGFSLVHQKERRWQIWAGAGMLSLLLFQSPVALIALFVLGIAFFLEPGRPLRWKQALLFGGVLLTLTAVVVAVWSSLPSLKDSSPLTLFFTWLQNNFNFQSQVTEKASGQVQRLMDMLGKNFRVLLFLAYGSARPVLPAALSDISANPVWYVINLFRSLGWYSLAPVLAFATALLFLKDELSRRRQLIWLAVISWVLVLIAAANGGADAWDNPRYRAIFLVWQALVAAWAYVYARESGNLWLKRLLWVEVTFILIFTWWYLTRLPALNAFHTSVEVTVGLCLLAALAVMGVGWLRDRKARERS
jgi:hypothetical protein